MSLPYTRPDTLCPIPFPRLEKSNGETANLIRFLDPEDIDGTGLLSIDQADDQWLYQTFGKVLSLGNAPA